MFIDRSLASFYVLVLWTLLVSLIANHRFNSHYWANLLIVWVFIPFSLLKLNRFQVYALFQLIQTEFWWSFCILRVVLVHGISTLLFNLVCWAWDLRLHVHVIVRKDLGIDTQRLSCLLSACSLGDFLGFIVVLTCLVLLPHVNHLEAPVWVVLTDLSVLLPGLFGIVHDNLVKKQLLQDIFFKSVRFELEVVVLNWVSIDDRLIVLWIVQFFEEWMLEHFKRSQSLSWVICH